MTYEETKTWLRRAWHIDDEINTLMRQYHDAMDRVTNIAQSLSGMPGAPTKDPHKFDKVAEIEDQINNRLDDLNEAKREIEAAVSQLKDDNERNVLRMYYITDGNGRHMTFEQISNELHYSVKQISRIHNNAIKSIMSLNVR